MALYFIRWFRFTHNSSSRTDSLIKSRKTLVIDTPAQDCAGLALAVRSNPIEQTTHDTAQRGFSTQPWKPIRPPLSPHNKKERSISLQYEGRRAILPLSLLLPHDCRPSSPLTPLWALARGQGRCPLPPNQIVEQQSNRHVLRAASSNPLSTRLPSNISGSGMWDRLRSMANHPKSWCWSGRSRFRGRLPHTPSGLADQVSMHHCAYEITIDMLSHCWHASLWSIFWIQWEAASLGWRHLQERLSVRWCLPSFLGTKLQQLGRKTNKSDPYMLI